MLDFNLDTLDELQQSQEAGVAVAIRDPADPDKVLLSITVAGPDSKQQLRAFERASEEAQARGNLTPLTREENDIAAKRLLARCCIGWDAKDKSGAEIPFNEDNAFQLIDRYPIIRKEIDNAAANRNRFIKRSKTA